MDWYTIFKFLHVASAICWVGGGIVLVFLAITAGRAKDVDGQMTVIKQVASLAMTWFIPSSLGTVIFGIAAATIGGWWSEAWVSLGLLGFVATFVTGNFLIRPSADAIANAEKDGKRDVAVAAGARLLNVSKFDFVMLFTVVADMVFKPAWGSTVLLGIMALVLLAGFVLFLLPAISARTAVA